MNFDTNRIVENDGNVKTLQGGIWFYDNRLIYTGITQKTIANTLDESSFFDDTDAIGTRTIPANFLQIGKVIKIATRSDFSNIGNPTNTIRIKLGGTIVESSATFGASNTNAYAEIVFEILVKSVGATGSILGAGKTVLTGSPISRTLLISSPLEINTTVPLTVDVTYQWGIANESNILKTISSTIQIFN